VYPSGLKKAKTMVIAHLGGPIPGDVPEELAERKGRRKGVRSVYKKSVTEEDRWEDEANALMAEAEEDLAELQALRDAMFPR
jgi:hypothetical protein